MKEKFILKRTVISIILFTAVTAFILILRNSSINSNSGEFTSVEMGSFKISVSSTGELFAEKSLDLKGPMLPNSGSVRRRGRGRSIRSMSIKILDIVPEGTVVNKGDYVAQLDRTDYENMLKDEAERLKTLQTEYEMKIHDTAITLAALRDDIKNQSFVVEVAAISLEISKYEPPATIRKAEMKLDKEKRSLKQKKKIYNLRFNQKLREINNIRIDISRQKRLLDDLNNYLAGFTITSPARGMVIYKRNWDGTKRETGSTINPFDMTIATLPDLSSMISKTYVSEIYIGKMKKDQKVNITIDAFPDKSFTGTVASIARIGEKLPNSYTKMFEVIIRLNEYDPELRPSMTSSNEIIIESFDNVVYVPLECVHADTDGFPYVYTRHKTKQVVIPGKSNDKYIIIKEGLDAGIELYLSTPENSSEFTLIGKDLYSAYNHKYLIPRFDMSYCHYQVS